MTMLPKDTAKSFTTMFVCRWEILSLAGVKALRLSKAVLGMLGIHSGLRFRLTHISYRPGRIHHCMRSIGAAQASLNLMLQRVTDPSRKTFGKYLHQHGTVIHDIALSRAEIESARLLVLSAALQVG